ncbi:MAG: uroporphyrinogen-III synthase [Sinimarinibacterium sp.]|jgi:uroporphyrinogen-III synthase
MDEPNLQGRRIAVPETRELDVFATMLEKRGAEVLRCPLIAILDAPDPAPVLAWIRAFNAGSCDDLVLLTGEGLRRLVVCIERHEPALREGFIRRLSEVRILTRGPKPGRALRELGLKPTLTAVEPTTRGVIETLLDLDLKGRRVGVQLYGTEPNAPLQHALQAAGATVLTVAPYVYADAADAQRVLDLIDRLAQGSVDAIAFTSMAQVERLFRVARDAACEDALKAGLVRTRVAAVGPVVADALAVHGIAVQAMPEGDYFMKPLMRALADAFGANP